MTKKLETITVEVGVWNAVCQVVRGVDNRGALGVPSRVGAALMDAIDAAIVEAVPEAPKTPETV